jgi:hypothetical protein
MKRYESCSGMGTVGHGRSVVFGMDLLMTGKKRCLRALTKQRFRRLKYN